MVTRWTTKTLEWFVYSLTPPHAHTLFHLAPPPGLYVGIYLAFHYHTTWQVMTKIQDVNMLKNVLKLVMFGWLCIRRAIIIIITTLWWIGFLSRMHFCIGPVFPGYTPLWIHNNTQISSPSTAPSIMIPCWRSGALKFRTCLINWCKINQGVQDIPVFFPPGMSLSLLTWFEQQCIFVCSQSKPNNLFVADWKNQGGKRRSLEPA